MCWRTQGISPPNRPRDLNMRRRPRFDGYVVTGTIDPSHLGETTFGGVPNGRGVGYGHSLHAGFSLLGWLTGGIRSQQNRSYRVARLAVVRLLGAAPSNRQTRITRGLCKDRIEARLISQPGFVEIRKYLPSRRSLFTGPPNPHCIAVPRVILRSFQSLDARFIDRIIEGI
jgi:hypothetical protein